MIGKNWITHMVDENGTNIYNRIEINKVVTEFHKKLYDEPKSISTKPQKITLNSMKKEEIHTILKLNVEKIRNLKSNKAIS